ncbi:PorV/PorQ family protein [bacterium]|nr:PorV/PorQ family protein [bacterium]RQV93473.1 MAG: PorV/PorQ family protein [bacterium]
MRKWIPFLFLFLILSSQGYGGGFASLQLGGDARAGALGMAYTALSDDGSGSYWNPAGLVRSGEKELILSVQRWIEDVQSAFLGFGMGRANTGLGIHILHTEVSGLEYRIVPSPTPIHFFSTHELIVGISYGRIIRDNLSIGITLKSLYEKLFVEEAFGLAADFGFLYSIWDNELRVGGVLQNVGKTNLMRHEAITLPVTAKVGFAFSIPIFRNDCLFVLDGIKGVDLPYHVHTGIEYGWWNRLSIRLGYQIGYETRSITGGIGLAWDRYRLNYSYMPLHSGFGDSHRLSIGLVL